VASAASWVSLSTWGEIIDRMPTYTEAMPRAIIPLQPARSESSAPLALTAPTAIPLHRAVNMSGASLAVTVPTAIPVDAARSRSSASLVLTASPAASSSAYEGALITIKPITAAELHPHEETHVPWTVLEGVPVLLTVGVVAGVSWVRRERCC
jgi:hypothetical protein